MGMYIRNPMKVHHCKLLHADHDVRIDENSGEKMENFVNEIKIVEVAHSTKPEFCD